MAAHDVAVLLDEGRNLPGIDGNVRCVHVAEVGHTQTREREPSVGWVAECTVVVVGDNLVVEG